MSTPMMRDYLRAHGCVSAKDAQRVQPSRACQHTPDQTYTREPCVCGRELWPPRGRGRGESLLSPRRINAKLRAVEAWRLNLMDYTWEQIAAQLGYRTRGGAWRAVQRLRDQQAAWYRHYDRLGKRDWYERKQALEQLRATYAAEDADEDTLGTIPPLRGAEVTNMTTQGRSHCEVNQ